MAKFATSHPLSAFDFGGETALVTGGARGIGRAVCETLRNLEWFEVKEMRGHIVDGSSVGHYQAVLKVGFRLE